MSCVPLFSPDEQIDWTNNEANGEVLWALTDHLGTVRDLVNDAGTVQNHKSYDAFGNVTAETNAAKDAVFGFTGKLFDDATGLQNNLNRWYDANVGSWISEDPIGFAAGDANLGRYVENSPTQYVDPTGEYSWWPPSQWWPWGPAEPGLPVEDPTPIATAPVGTTLGPPGVTEGAGALEAAPGIIRTADIQRAREKWQRCIGTPEEDAAWRDYEDKKRKHKDKFIPK